MTTAVLALLDTLVPTVANCAPIEPPGGEDFVKQTSFINQQQRDGPALPLRPVEPPRPDPSDFAPFDTDESSSNEDELSAPSPLPERSPVVDADAPQPTVPARPSAPVVPSDALFNIFPDAAPVEPADFFSLPPAPAPPLPLAPAPAPALGLAPAPPSNVRRCDSCAPVTCRREAWTRRRLYRLALPLRRRHWCAPTRCAVPHAVGRGTNAAPGGRLRRVGPVQPQQVVCASMPALRTP